MSAGWKVRRLLEDPVADLGQRQPVARRVEALDPAGGLHWLERHAAHARLPQREVDDRADLIVIEPLLERDDQRRRDAVLVQVARVPGCGPRPDRPLGAHVAGAASSESNWR